MKPQIRNLNNAHIHNNTKSQEYDQTTSTPRFAIQISFRSCAFKHIHHTTFVHVQHNLHRHISDHTAIWHNNNEVWTSKKSESTTEARNVKPQSPSPLIHPTTRKNHDEFGILRDPAEVFMNWQLNACKSFEQRMEEMKWNVNQVIRRNLTVMTNSSNNNKKQQDVTRHDRNIKWSAKTTCVFAFKVLIFETELKQRK
jgi:hypothetical protein